MPNPWWSKRGDSQKAQELSRTVTRQQSSPAESEERRYILWTKTARVSIKKAQHPETALRPDAVAFFRALFCMECCAIIDKQYLLILYMHK